MPISRTPGVSITTPPPRRRSQVEREVVWRPRSHFALISPVSSRSSGWSAFKSDDLPTPEWPASTVVPSASARPSASSPAPLVAETAKIGTTTA